MERDGAHICLSILHRRRWSLKESTSVKYRNKLTIIVEHEDQCGISELRSQGDDLVHSGSGNGKRGSLVSEQRATGG